MLTKKITIVVNMDDEAEAFEDEILETLENDLNLVEGFEVVTTDIEEVDSSEINIPMTFFGIKEIVNNAIDDLSGEGIGTDIEGFEEETLNVRNEVGDVVLRISLLGENSLEFTNILNEKGTIIISSLDEFKNAIADWVIDMLEV